MIARVIALILALLLATPAVAEDEVKQAPQAAEQPASTAKPSPAKLAPANPTDLAMEVVRSFDLTSSFAASLAPLERMIVPVVGMENPGKKELVEDVVHKSFRASIAAHIGEIERSKAKAYAELFTTDELRDILAFYKSPSGQKLIKVTPQLSVYNDAEQVHLARTATEDIGKYLTAELKKNNLKVPKSMEAQ